MNLDKFNKKKNELHNYRFFQEQTPKNAHFPFPRKMGK